MSDHKPNNDNPKLQTVTTSDGRTWVEPIPEQVQREIAASEAIDALHLCIQKAATSTGVALRANDAVSRETPALELLAAWAVCNAALTEVIADLVKAGADAIDAVRDALPLR